MENKMYVAFNQLVEAYHTTALWVEGLDNILSIGLNENLKNYSIAECSKFVNSLKVKFGIVKTIELISIDGQEGNLTGHDLYLTRNGHGAGFWDKSNEYGGFSDDLSEIASAMGNDDRYIEIATGLGIND